MESGDEEQTLYCICQSPDVDRFMIACDKCEEWYHGDCIGISQRKSREIEKYFCDKCIAKNSSLKVLYKPVKKKSGKEPSDYTQKKLRGRPETGTHKKVSRCGQCEGCSRMDDCGRCETCKDMRKFGGANKLKQKCRLRQCQNFGSAKSHKRAAIKYESDSEADYVPETKKTHKEPVKTSIKKASVSNNKSAGPRLSGVRRLSSPGPEVVLEQIRQCCGPRCVKPTQPNSKYCSDKCGLALAQSRLCKILPARISTWQSSPCIAEELNKRQLTEIRSQQLECKAKLADLDSRQRRLESLVAASSHLKPVSDDEDENESEWTIHCVTCGHEVSGRLAVKHMEKCFVRFESQTSYGAYYKTRVEGDSICDYYSSQQKTYCKRLKVICPEHYKEPKTEPEAVCGFPLPDSSWSTDASVADVFKFSDQYCRVQRRACRKHVAWQRVRRAQIDMERVHQWMLLDELFDKERSNLNAMSQRAGVISLMLHSTYDHDPSAPIKSLDQILKQSPTC